MKCSEKVGYEIINNLKYIRDLVFYSWDPGSIVPFYGFVFVSNIMEKNE